MDEKPCNSSPEVKKAAGSADTMQQEDYYMENGYLVFTARYLRNRGYCCANGCRHCPYE